MPAPNVYSHLSNKRGGWNKRGGGAKVAKSINVEVGIIVEVGIFLKNQETWRGEVFFSKTTLIYSKKGFNDISSSLIS